MSETTADKTEDKKAAGAGAADGAPSKPVQGIDVLLNSSMISYRRLPMLEVVFDKLARFLTTTLRNFTSVNVEVGLLEIATVRFGDYLDSVPLPTLINIFDVPEWDSSGLITVDSQLFYSLINILLGGRKSGKGAEGRIEGKPFTMIERHLVERFVHIILGDFSSSFDGITSVSFQFERQETIPRLAAIVPENNAALVAKIKVEMDNNHGGVFECVIPYSALEPVREQLLQMFMGEKMGRDSIWESHLSQELWDANIVIEAQLAQLCTSLGETLSWKKGTFLPLHLPQNTTVHLRAGGETLFGGKIVQSKRSIAVEIEKVFGRKSTT